MTQNTPARSTPQLDLMRRLKIRDAQHGQLAMPFLEKEERERLGHILQASVEHGTTDAVERRAHDFLVQLGQRDALLKFLTDDERQQLAALTQLGSTPSPQPKSQSMSGGEFLTIAGVVVSAAIATCLIYRNPATNASAIWVGVWGVAFGGSLIRRARHRSGTSEGSVTFAEGFLATLIWGIAAAAVVLFGGHLLSPGWAGFLSFAGAGIISRAVLKIKDDSNDD